MPEKNQLPEYAVNIKRIRNEKKLTKTKLASRSEVSRSAIIAYEKGERRPKIGTILKIASALEVSPMDIDSFGSYQHDANVPAFIDGANGYHDTWSLIATWLREQASPEDREIVLTFVNRLGFKENR